MPTMSLLKLQLMGKTDLIQASFKSPKDAEFMDPQLRMLLTHSWKAIEDAGYAARQIPQTSVFMSASNNSYRAAAVRYNREPGDAGRLCFVGACTERDDSDNDFS